MSDLKNVQARMARFSLQKTLIENREVLARTILALRSDNVNEACNGLDFVLESLKMCRKELG